jgi:hypothetical protein
VLVVKSISPCQFFGIDGIERAVANALIDSLIQNNSSLLAINPEVVWLFWTAPIVNLRGGAPPLTRGSHRRGSLLRQELSKRRTHSPEFKARVAMEAISGNTGRRSGAQTRWNASTKTQAAHPGRRNRPQ